MSITVMDTAESVPPQSYVFFTSFMALSTAYHLLTPQFTTTKQCSWIMTTISSFVMTAVSIPFLVDFVRDGGGVRDIRHLPVVAVTANRFFQAYLLADLSTGVVFYRSQVNLVTGWVHHILYIIIVEYTIRHSWSHVFCLAAFMELPTFILGLSSLYPSLRSNILFAITFFTTRILFHIVLCIAYYQSENRMRATNGSLAPAVILTFVFPLHVMWFVGCVKGFVRRAKQKKEMSTSGTPRTAKANIPVIKLDIYPSPSSPALPLRTRTRSRSRSPAPLKSSTTLLPTSPTPLPIQIPPHLPLPTRLLRRPYTHYTHYRTRLSQRLSQRRQVLEKAFREFRDGYAGYAGGIGVGMGVGTSLRGTLSLRRATRAVTVKGVIEEVKETLGSLFEILGGLVGEVAGREVVYAWVGLGRDRRREVGVGVGVEKKDGDE